MEIGQQWKFKEIIGGHASKPRASTGVDTAIIETTIGSSCNVHLKFICYWMKTDLHFELHLQ